MQMRAMVTGSSGFIGSHLVTELEGRGYRVQPYDRSKGYDIQNKGKLVNQMSDCDVVFNLAGLLGTHELNKRSRIQEAIDINIKGTVNVLDAAVQTDTDMIEIGKPNPWNNTYSITKHASEQFTKLYENEHELNTWTVRWYNIYGPYQHYGSPQKLVPTACVHALHDAPIEIYGSGEQTADHIYVEDAVKATVDAYETADMEGEIVDIGSGDDRTVNEVVSMIVDLTNSDSDIRHVEMRSGEKKDTTIRANITKLYSKVGFRPELNLRQGLQKTIDYYKSNISEYGVKEDIITTSIE